MHVHTYAPTNTQQTEHIFNSVSLRDLSDWKVYSVLHTDIQCILNMGNISIYHDSICVQLKSL